MTLLKRFGYYLGGFSIGLVLLAFFFSGKRTSCAYGPEARVIKTISNKERVFSDETIDSALVASIFKYGNVNFSKSDTKRDSCKRYIIEAEIDGKDYVLTVDNCTKAKIISLLN
jgi:hypothetical protein